MYGIIYKITNKVDGKFYIGQTTRTVEKRFAEHAKCKTTYIGKAIRKYGEENFTLEVIEECEMPEQLNEREMFWITELNSKYPNGYNLTDGVEGGIPCDATRAKLSAANSGENNPNYGKHPTQETRAKMSAARTGEKNPFYGKHHAPESIAKISAAASERSGEKNPFFGKHHTPESKAKLAAANTGKKASAETRAKLSVAHTGREVSDETRAKLSVINSGENNPNYGKHPTQETRAKMSAARTGEKNPFYGKHHADKTRIELSLMHRVESPYKNLLAEMDKRQMSYKQLAEFLGLARTTISQKMTGKQNFTKKQVAKLVELFNKPAEYLLARD